ncbi:hypothetical protein LshimejAT787_0705700 [Lyophyllum shimeji]|uniref:Uncharacterized protein n=1 Tax=Lyophyllum shimeji TaxID=47721 RepID=A0A9P3UQD4_LYOSH|nr:hypothetical protein LshimejAT787_0705700 [Lyophyllum shimeji]
MNGADARICFLPTFVPQASGAKRGKWFTPRLWGQMQPTDVYTQYTLSIGVAKARARPEGMGPACPGMDIRVLLSALAWFSKVLGRASPSPHVQVMLLDDGAVYTPHLPLLAIHPCVDGPRHL